MNKIVSALSVLMLVLIATPVFAVSNNAEMQNTGTQGGTSTQARQQIQISMSPTAGGVQNQNRIETKNQGEDSGLQVGTQEQEGYGDGQEVGAQNRNQNTVTNMSEVAKQVQQLLQMKTQGGIGQQVRQIAQEQNQAQAQIREQLNKLESKSKFARLLTGTDYGAIKNLKTRLEQNQLRIMQLEQLKTQVSNQGDTTMIQAAIEALVQQNTALQEQITAEEETKSLFGWLYRFIAK